jgi:hypothetical protein
MKARRILITGCAAALVAFAIEVYQDNLPADHPAIQYSHRAPNDPAAALNRKLESGEVKLEYNQENGYLPSLLKLLGVPVDSQALVFSKTSFQAPKISPRNPRAIYFSDNVAVGWVRGGSGMEVAALDPNQGIIFYTLDEAQKANPKLVRQQVCLRCHQGPATEGVPGIFVGSVFPNSSGDPYRQDAIITDHRTAFADRWGGWYVNAQSGEQRDRANSIAPDPASPEELDTEGKQNLTSLLPFFSPSGYLSPVSDIVALMTFEHQTQMVNMLTRLNWEARIAEYNHSTDGSALDRDIDSLVAYMLFVDEAKLAGPVRGVSTFTKTFPERGLRDKEGRSLRDFDLQTRLFKYPLSYMIYSDAFDALPPPVQDRVYRKLFDVLTGADRSRKFASLAMSDRKSILEILTETKANLPAYFHR